ncbi:hypothetical protein D3C81_1749320 [compost metagenome]
MVQKHDGATGLGGDSFHTANDLSHGTAGVLLLNVKPAQGVQHHQATTLGSPPKPIEPVRLHDVGLAADQWLDQQASDNRLALLVTEVCP